MNPSNSNRILWAIGYTPGKIGSFEEYIFEAAKGLRDLGMKMYVVFPTEPLAAYRRMLEDAGVTVSVIAVGKRLQPSYILGLARLLRREQIFLLHSNFDNVNFNASIAAFLARVPKYFWHQHNFMGESFSPARWLFLKFLGRISDRVICCTAAKRANMIGHGLPGAAATVVYNGPDITKFSAASAATDESALRAELGIKPGEVVLSCIGTSYPEKNVEGLVRSFAELSREAPAVRLLLVGAKVGTRYPQIAQMVLELGLENSVVITEMRNDVAAILRLTDVVVAAPLVEVSLLSLMEAMASGKPVVSARIGGIPEVVADGVAGLLVPPGDEAALAEALRALIRDPERRAAMGAAGRDLAQSRFNLKAMVENTLELYRQVLAGQLPS